LSRGGDPLARLAVLDRLEVGPPEVSPSRLSVPYRVTVDGATHELELAFRWAEPVFEIGNPASENLAAMVGAQVALNYGLFAREIVFHGRFTAADRRFIEVMTENTSREIYVKKLLQENPFLTDAARGLPEEPRDRFTRAKLRFDPTAEAPPGASWEATPERWAVLSSGGKDSLLSFGLLRELQQEVHPVFVNESGRHWFTALNAFRHFRESVPHTARVWTNCDRVFNGLLRLLPIVRPDFQRLRADIYPIRLWTVAVFLFAALPILRKRRIGWLVIGCEHDTTVRLRHRGIPHYDGLFDQSRYFDRALSRYFGRKGWGVTQLSLLRPLSELLIERTLARRYPDLARHQVSCHAAHKEGGRIVPCGRCEKCRRIVGMLVASQVDPALMGYDAAAVEGVLDSLVGKGVHQERPGAEHLAWQLHERGAIPEPRLADARGRRHPEIMRLRFHPERSPLDDLPERIRAPLLEVLLAEAEGAVERVGREWRELEPRAGKRSRKQERQPAEPPSCLWGDMTWPEAERRLAEVDLALLPVGAIEQHGPHLPLDVDAFDAELLARKVAEACARPAPLVLPLIAYGVSYHHDDFPGTLSVSNEALAQMVYEIGMSAARNGIRKLVIVNGHGGNAATLRFAAQRINRDASIFTCVDNGETSDPDIYALVETPNDVHAGEIETSTTLAVRPEVVRPGLAKPFVPRFSSTYLDFTSRHSIEWYARTARLSESGVFGDPTKASAAKGKRIWRLMIRHLVELVEHLKGLTLDEIHERRV